LVRKAVYLPGEPPFHPKRGKAMIAYFQSKFFGAVSTIKNIFLYRKEISQRVDFYLFKLAQQCIERSPNLEIWEAKL
jgi:hypothetical protein